MILCVIGGLGSGKTLLMSALAHRQQLAGRVVAANYALRGAMIFRYWDELFSFSEGVYAWDEAHVDVDSRLFAQNIEATSWFLQTRKAGLDLYLTTQSFDQVDLRVRNMVDLLILMEKWGAGRSRFSVIDGFSGRLKRRGIFLHRPELYGLYDTRQRVERLQKRKAGDWQTVSRGGA